MERWHCDVCDKDFSAKTSQAKHETSVTHKKLLLEKGGESAERGTKRKDAPTSQEEDTTQSNPKKEKLKTADEAPVETQPPTRDWSKFSGVPSHSWDLPITLFYGATTAQDKVFVSDLSTHSIRCFDPASGEQIWTNGAKGKKRGQFEFPSGLAISSANQNELFVSDDFNCRIQVLNSENGKFLRTFGTEGDGPGQLNSPYGIGIDPTKQEVHVCESRNQRISVFTESGEFLRFYGSEGDAPGQLNRPCGIVVDGEKGLVAIVEVQNPRVSIFTTGGEFVRAFGHGEGEDPKGKFTPNDHKWIARDPVSGNIAVCDHFANTVQIFDWEGQWLAGFGPNLPVRGPELDRARAIAFGPQGKLYLCCIDKMRCSKLLVF